MANSGKKSVTSTRSEFDENFGNWQKLRDAARGQQAIKNTDEGRAYIYLPPLSGHYAGDGTTVNKKYETYLAYANWYAATGRTIDGLVGLIFRKNPIIVNSESTKHFVEDFTLEDQSLIEFAHEVVSEVVTVNRVGILVDLPSGSQEGMTREQLEQLNIRPYARIYKAETIRNWKEDIINNVRTLTMVVLEEKIDDTQYMDEFEDETEIQYRVLDLIPIVNENNEVLSYRYRQRLFKQEIDDKHDKNWVEVESKFPMINGNFLNYIPFYCLTDKGTTFKIHESMVNDLCDINIAHYRNSANLENGLIWTGNPTPYVSGLVTSGGKEINLGSTECIQLESGGKAGYMEFTGQGLKPLTEAMDSKEKLMALVGAKIIASDKKATETAETATIHRAGEQGVLATMANLISVTLTKVWRLMVEWSALTDDVKIELNTDYVPIDIPAADMVALLQMHQAGVIDMPTVRWNLRKGERIANTKSDEDIDEELAKNPPKEDESMPLSSEEEFPPIITN